MEKGRRNIWKYLKHCIDRAVTAAFRFIINITYLCNSFKFWPLDVGKNRVPCFESIPFCEAAWWLGVRLLWWRRPRLAKGDHFPMCLLETPRVSLRFISYYGNWKMETLVTISLVLFLQYFTKTAGFLEDICPCTNETHCARPASRNKSIGSLQVRRYITFLVSNNRYIIPLM